jgi:peptidoglycan/xylan/chitin deacetylase (PgdA/CDA1 family)
MNLLLRLSTSLLVVSALTAALPARAAPNTIELHQRLETLEPGSKTIALTLDACGGAFDADLISFLIQRHIPATLFVTKKWLDRNPIGLAVLQAHGDLFEIEDHGAAHVPAVLGAGRRVYGIAGVGDMRGLTQEVQGGAAAITKSTGSTPRWYRGATAEYDAEALKAIEAMGYRVAGFSVNADAGATLSKQAVITRLSKVRGSDIIIAHMNKPKSQTAEGLAVGLARLQSEGFKFVRLGENKLASVR